MAKYRIIKETLSNGEVQYRVKVRFLYFFWSTCEYPYGFGWTKAIFDSEEDALKLVKDRTKQEPYITSKEIIYAS